MFDGVDTLGVVAHGSASIRALRLCSYLAHHPAQMSPGVPSAFIGTNCSIGPTTRAVDASHVFGCGHDVEPGSVRLAALIDPAFLAEAGWDRASRVLSLPAEHPLLGWQGC